MVISNRTSGEWLSQTGQAVNGFLKQDKLLMVISNRTTQTVLSNGTTQTVFSNRTTQTVLSNGTTQTVLSNKTTQTVLSNGTTQTVLSNGTTQTVLSNKTTQTGQLKRFSQNIHFPISHPIPDIPPISRQGENTTY